MNIKHKNIKTICTLSDIKIGECFTIEGYSGVYMRVTGSVAEPISNSQLTCVLLTLGTVLTYSLNIKVSPFKCSLVED